MNPALLAELMALACAWADYPALEQEPAVEIVAAEEIALPGARALYIYALPAQGVPARILLDRSLDLARAFGRSVLLHELVHACQDAAEGAAAYGTPLWHAREREAYRVQHRYLAASGEAQLYPFGRQPFWLPRDD